MVRNPTPKIRRNELIDKSIPSKSLAMTANKNISLTAEQSKTPSKNSNKSKSESTRKNSVKKQELVAYKSIPSKSLALTSGPSEKINPTKTVHSNFEQSDKKSPNKSLALNFNENEIMLDVLIDQIVKLEDKIREHEYDLSSFKRISIIPKMDSFMSYASVTSSSENRSKVFTSKLEKNESITSIQLVLDQLNSHLKKRYELNTSESNKGIELF